MMFSGVHQVVVCLLIMQLKHVYAVDAFEGTLQLSICYLKYVFVT